MCSEMKVNNKLKCKQIVEQSVMERKKKVAEGKRRLRELVIIFIFNNQYCNQIDFKIDLDSNSEQHTVVEIDQKQKLKAQISAMLNLNAFKTFN